MRLVQLNLVRGVDSAKLKGKIVLLLPRVMLGVVNGIIRENSSAIAYYLWVSNGCRLPCLGKIVGRAVWLHEVLHMLMSKVLFTSHVANA